MRIRTKKQFEDFFGRPYGIRKLYRDGDIVFEPTGEGRWGHRHVRFFDRRTRVEPIGGEKRPVVFPVGTDGIRVWIVCPYCGQIHAHGCGRGKPGSPDGFRRPHCKDIGDQLKPDYVIRGGQVNE
jgi:hypothetical protein